jgi:hypothetical protein
LWKNLVSFVESVDEERNFAVGSCCRYKEATAATTWQRQCRPAIGGCWETLATWLSARCL